MKNSADPDQMASFLKSHQCFQRRINQGSKMENSADPDQMASLEA